jgi:hypothetical protein
MRCDGSLEVRAIRDHALRGRRPVRISSSDRKGSFEILGTGLARDQVCDLAHGRFGRRRVGRREGRDGCCISKAALHPMRSPPAEVGRQDSFNLSETVIRGTSSRFEGNCLLGLRNAEAPRRWTQKRFTLISETLFGFLIPCVAFALARGKGLRRSAIPLSSRLPG